jgi:hypothetical protein
MKTDSEDLAISMASQVDCLVCGELNETDRQQLLAWLEAEPDRWRLCGVAFLEAQVWSQAINRWPPTDDRSGDVTSAIARRLPQRSATSRRALYRQAGIAAAVVVAFGLGMACHDFSTPVPRATETTAATSDTTAASESDNDFIPPTVPSKHESVLASLNVETGEGLGRSTPIQIPVVPAATDQGRVQERAAISDYVRQQWERRGYNVSVERRFLFAKLADGQQVVVPVEQLHVNPVPVHIN